MFGALHQKHLDSISYGSGMSSLRMQRAKTLLANPAMSVTQVGFNLGFSDTSSFTTTFRKHTGLTPTAYRRTLE
jgi:AraC family transcriptional regulator